MKKLIALFILVLFGANLNAQETGIRKISFTYVNSRTFEDAFQHAKDNPLPGFFDDFMRQAVDLGLASDKGATWSLGFTDTLWYDSTLVWYSLIDEGELPLMPGFNLVPVIETEGTFEIAKADSIQYTLLTITKGLRILIKNNKQKKKNPNDAFLTQVLSPGSWKGKAFKEDRFQKRVKDKRKKK